jgi:hypothetical protein
VDSGEDVEGYPFHLVTEGVLSMFSELFDEATYVREVDDASEQRESLLDNRWSPATS